MVFKYLKYMALAPLCFLVGCGDGQESDLEKLCLKGKVKSMSEYKYRAEERYGKVEKGEPFREEGWDKVILFGENGMYEEVQHVTPNGDLVGRTVYQYGKENRKTMEQEYDSEGGLSEKTVFSYNEDNKLYQVLRLNDMDGIVSSMMIDVRNDGLVEHNYYGPSGLLLRREVMDINRKGLPEETKIYSGEKKLVNHRKEEYNSNGQLERLQVFAPEDGTLIMTVNFIYDDKSNVILQEGVENISGEGFLPVKYEYEFDDKDNWIRCIEYEGSTPAFVTEREFEYYQK